MTKQIVKMKKYLFFILLSYAYFFSTVGNVALGISNASSDDGIIAHAISYTSPRIFTNDLQANTFRIETPTSLMNLIPAIAYRNLHMDPLFFWTFFLVVQTILYPISIYGIIKFITHSKKQAVLITVLFINFRPQTRNLSYSGDLDWMPYAMWLAESFFVFAIYLYLKEYRKSSFMLIALTCLIHPSLGVWIIFFFILFDYLVTKGKKYQWKTPLSVSFIFFAFLIYNYFYVKKQSSSIVGTKYLQSVLTNSHFNSISIFTNEFNVYAIINSSIIMLVGLTIYFIFTPEKKDFILRNNFYILVKTAYFVSIIGILTQALGLLTENLVLVRLMGTRFTSILAILSFILFLVLLSKEKIDSKVSLFLAITFIFFPGSIIIWICGIRKALTNWSSSSLSKRILFILLTLLSIITSIRMFNYIFNNYRVISLDTLIKIFDESHLFIRNFFFNFLSIKLQLTLYIFIIFILYIIQKIKSQKYIIRVLLNHNTAIIILLTFLLLIGKSTYSSDRFNLRDQHFKQIQEWARYRSTPDSSYLVLVTNTYGGWRNYSRRAQLSLHPSNGPYGFYKDTELISDRINNLVKKYPNDNLNNPSKSLLEEMKSTLSLDYLVVSSDLMNYDLDIEYKNKDFIIYKL